MRRGPAWLFAAVAVVWTVLVEDAAMLLYAALLLRPVLRRRGTAGGKAGPGSPGSEEHTEHEERSEGHDASDLERHGDR